MEPSFPGRSAARKMGDHVLQVSRAFLREHKQISRMRQLHRKTLLTQKAARTVKEADRRIYSQEDQKAEKGIS